jgi:hypothetical protein
MYGVLCSLLRTCGEQALSPPRVSGKQQGQRPTSMLGNRDERAKGSLFAARAGVFVTPAHTLFFYCVAAEFSKACREDALSTG